MVWKLAGEQAQSAQINLPRNRRQNKGKAVSLVWYSRTAKGWQRFPVVLGANNRIKVGYVIIDGVLTHSPNGRFEIRLYEGRGVVYKRGY